MEYFTTDRARYLFYTAALLIAALTLVAVFNIAYPQPPAGQWQPAPDPPMVDNSVKVEILSNNQVFSNNCFGSCSK